MTFVAQRREKRGENYAIEKICIQFVWTSSTWLIQITHQIQFYNGKKICFILTCCCHEQCNETQKSIHFLNFFF